MLLDVRPPTEVERVGIPGAVAVPMFVPDSRMELGSLLARYAAFGTGGWWIGGGHFIPNADFLAQVSERCWRWRWRRVLGCRCFPSNMTSLACWDTVTATVPFEKQALMQP